jgi:hypothetical protein
MACGEISVRSEKEALYMCMPTKEFLAFTYACYNHVTRTAEVSLDRAGKVSVVPD